MTRVQHGPGPIVHGPSLTNPDHYIVELPDGTGPQLMTREEIAAIPLKQQWFSGTQTGLINSWWSYEVAEKHGIELGVIVGQVMPITIEQLRRLDPSDTVLILANANGQPFRGA